MNKINKYLSQIKLPAPESHKGENGKLLIIGGSQLFHAASKWSLDVASKFVDMVFYSSVKSNNRLVEKSKSEFWNGIVIERHEIENYIQEADVILIGPGMERKKYQQLHKIISKLTPKQWQNDTQKINTYLLQKYPDKKWVLDAGALQMIEPKLLNNNCIITPHEGELKQLCDNGKLNKTNCQQILRKKEVTVLLKGVVDQVWLGSETIEISGGNAGMTKGGTGDVLAGLVAALYCSHDAATSAVVGSYLNKKAGDNLYQQVGPYFNASDLVDEVPAALWDELNNQTS